MFERTKLTWGMLALGLAVGFIGMNIVVTRPLVHRID
jgi:hypothetical protein